MILDGFISGCMRIYCTRRYSPRRTGSVNIIMTRAVYSHTTLNAIQYYISMSGAGRYSDVSFLQTVFIPNGFIPKDLYSERSFLRTVFSPLIRKAYNQKGHCSENFNSEMPLFRTVFGTKCFYSERFFFFFIYIPNGF